MAWLFIDTHVAGRIRYGLLGVRRAPYVVEREGRANRLLNLLASDWKRISSHLEGICIVRGPGTFSALRTGVLQANLFARILKKPLISVSADEAESLPDLTERLANGELVPSGYVAPVYDA